MKNDQVSSRMKIEYCCGENGTSYYTKGHVAIDDFLNVIKKEVGNDDLILNETPTHTWIRFCRDFVECNLTIIHALPNTSGSFAVTWIERNWN